MKGLVKIRPGHVLSLDETWPYQPEYVGVYRLAYLLKKSKNYVCDFTHDSDEHTIHQFEVFRCYRERNDYAFLYKLFYKGT